MSLTVTAYSDVYTSEYKSLLGKVIAVNGRINMRNNEKNLNLSKIIAVSWRKPIGKRFINIEIIDIICEE